MSENKKTKINQDIFIEETDLNNQSHVHLFGVCDGHGQFGHMVSAHLKRQLPKNIIDTLNPDSHVKLVEGINKAFLKTTQGLAKSEINLGFINFQIKIFFLIFYFISLRY